MNFGSEYIFSPSIPSKNDSLLKSSESEQSECGERHLLSPINEDEVIDDLLDKQAEQVLQKME